MKFYILGIFLVALQLASLASATRDIDGYDDLRIRNAQEAPLEEQEIIDEIFSSLKVPKNDDSLRTLRAANLTRNSFWIPSDAYEHDLSRRAQIALTGLKKAKSRGDITKLSYSEHKYTLPAPVCNKLEIACQLRDIIFRSNNEICNNLKNLWYGSKQTPYKRLLPNEYDDGLYKPKTRSVLGNEELPNAREIAYTVHTPKRTVSEWSTFMTYFGQFVDHDLTLTPKSAYDNGYVKACTCGTKDPECFNINVPYGDKMNYDQKCFPFVRSTPSINVFDCNLGPREQFNRRTHFLDLDHVYGSSTEEQEKLIDKDTGKFIVAVGEDGLPLLPTHPGAKCTSKSYGTCHMTGDTRCDENAMLTSFHTIYVLIHNYIIDGLTKATGGSVPPKVLFQEARKILIAMHQNIVYGEFLPALLGEKLVKAYGLLPIKEKYSKEYDLHRYPQVANEFATAAFRYGHTHITHETRMANEKYKLSKKIPIYHSQFNPQHYEKYFDDIVRGTCMEWSYTPTPQVNTYINDHLFEMMKNYDGAKRYSLPAMNVQRGRDHGLPGYNKYRELCGLNRAKSFNDFYNIPRDLRYQLASLYAHPDDVDLWTGIVSEDILEGGMIGATGGCIIAKTFKDIKVGDRFFYEYRRLLGLSPRQLNAIRKVSVKFLICAALGDKIEVVQKYPFFVADKYYNPLVSCKSVLEETLDALIKAWTFDPSDPADLEAVLSLSPEAAFLLELDIPLPKLPDEIIDIILNYYLYLPKDLSGSDSIGFGLRSSRPSPMSELIRSIGLEKEASVFNQRYEASRVNPEVPIVEEQVV